MDIGNFTPTNLIGTFSFTSQDAPSYYQTLLGGGLTGFAVMGYMLRLILPLSYPLRVREIVVYIKELF